MATWDLRNGHVDHNDAGPAATGNPVTNLRVIGTVTTTSGAPGAVELPLRGDGVAIPQYYGALADGVHDDAPAIQAAINANAHVFIPDGVYKIGSTLLIDDRNGFTLEGSGCRAVQNGLGAIEGLGTILYWTGNSSDPMVKVYGSSHTRIQSLKLFVQTVAGGGTALDTGIRYETKSAKVNTANRVRDVTVTAAPGATLHYGITFVAGTGGDANNDQMTFDNLTVSGYDTVGVDIAHAQAVDHRFYNLRMGSTVGSATYGIQTLNGTSFSVYGGGGGGHTGADFHCFGSQFSPISVYDFHSENSAHFWLTNTVASAVNVAGCVNLVGCSFSDSAGIAADGRVIDFRSQGPLNLINFTSGVSQAIAKRIHYTTTALDTYTLNVVGLLFYTSLENPFSGVQPTSMTGVEIVTSGAVGLLKHKLVGGTVTLAYSTNIAVDAGMGNDFRIDVANNTAFTIQFPSNGVKGQRITFRIRNVSGGAMGVITWTSYKMTAFVNPGSATTRTIEFFFDGFNYYEMNRAALDVPN